MKKGLSLPTSDVIDQAFSTEKGAIELIKVSNQKINIYLNESKPDGSSSPHKGYACTV